MLISRSHEILTHRFHGIREAVQRLQCFVLSMLVCPIVAIDDQTLCIGCSVLIRFGIVFVLNRFGIDSQSSFLNLQFKKTLYEYINIHFIKVTSKILFDTTEVHLGVTWLLVLRFV